MDYFRAQIDTGHSRRDIARSLAIAHSTVRDCLRRIEQAGVSWPLPPELSDGELETRLFPPAVPSNVVRPLPDRGGPQDSDSVLSWTPPLNWKAWSHE